MKPPTCDRVGDQRVRAHLAGRPRRARRPGPRRRGRAATTRPGRRTRRPARAAPARCSRPSRTGCAGRPGSARRRAGGRRAPAPPAPASVTRPPGLRKILASPCFRPSMRERVDARVHAGHDRDAGVGDAVEAAERRSRRRTRGWRRAGRRSHPRRTRSGGETGRRQTDQPCDGSAGRAQQLAGVQGRVAADRNSTRASTPATTAQTGGAGEDRRAPGRCRPTLSRSVNSSHRLLAVADLAGRRAGRPARRSSGAARSWSARRCRPACRPSGRPRRGRWRGRARRRRCWRARAALTGARASPKPKPPSTSGTLATASSRVVSPQLAHQHEADRRQQPCRPR